MSANTLKLASAELSCVIPTRNSGWCLGETLQSIFDQRETTTRVLIVDSDSDDDTLTVSRRFSVETISEPPGNMYRAINSGLKRCETEWLAYSNADDPLYGDAHHRLLAVGRSQSADVVYAISDCIDEHGRFMYSFAPPPPHRLGSFFRSGWMPFAQQTVIFRRSLYERLGGFDEQYTLCADFDFFLRAYCQGARFSRLNGRPTSRWRLHSNQLSQKHIEAAESQKQTSVGLAGLQPTFADRLTILRWRLQNWPNYLERIVRGSMLRGRLTFPRALDA